MSIRLEKMNGSPHSGTQFDKEWIRHSLRLMNEIPLLYTVHYIAYRITFLFFSGIFNNYSSYIYYQLYSAIQSGAPNIIPNDIENV